MEGPLPLKGEGAPLPSSEQGKQYPHAHSKNNSTLRRCYFLNFRIEIDGALIDWQVHILLFQIVGMLIGQFKLVCQFKM